MTARSAHVKTIYRLQRINNSHNGNPRYRVLFTDGTRAHTAADHSFAYSITEAWEGREVLVAIGGRGTITDMQPA